MKKILITIAALIIVFIIVMPYVTGRVAQSTSLKLVEQLKADQSQFGDASIVDYQRDYFSTSTKISWIGRSQADSPEAPIALVCEGRHGVFAFRYQCDSDNTQAYKDFVNIKLNGADPLSINGKVSILGGITQNFVMDAFEFTNEKDELINVLPGSLSISTDRHAKDFTFSGMLEGLTAVSEGSQFKIGSSEVNGTARLNQYKIGLGEVVASIDAVDISSNTDGESSLGRLRLNAHSIENGETLEFAYQLHLGSFTQTPAIDSQGSSEESSNSEKHEMSDVEFAVQLSGLNMAQAAVLKEKWQALPASSNKNNKASMLALVPEVEALLRKGLKINSSVTAYYNSKSMQTSLELALVGDLKFGDFLLLKINPKSFFSKINAQMSSKVPEEFLKLKSGADVSLANNPLYRNIDGVYQSETVLEHGEVKINDEQISLQEVLKLLKR